MTKKTIKESVTKAFDGSGITGDEVDKLTTLVEGIANDTHADLSKSYADKLTKNTEDNAKLISEALDLYTTEFADKFYKDNKVQIVAKERVELAENILTNVIKMLKESNSLPEAGDASEKLAKLSTENDKLKVQLLEKVAEVATMNATIMIESYGKDMTFSQFDKFKNLVGEFEFDDNFENRIKIIKESITPQPQAPIVEPEIKTPTQNDLFNPFK